MIRVLVCDDSAVMRTLIARVLESDPEMRVVARTGNGALAVDEVIRQPIDVVVLDVEMPVMNGLEALPHLLRASPDLRVVMASTLTTRGAEVTLRALRLGAADYIGKPSGIDGQSEAMFRRDLIAKVKALAHARASSSAPSERVASTLLPRPMVSPRLLAIGSSTGGPQALIALMGMLGPKLPVPVVLTQHMPAAFTPILAEHLCRAGKLPCAEARDGDVLEPGRVYVAPGDRHLLLERGREGPRTRLAATPPINYLRPSVDPMLETAAKAYDGRVLALMLTGMGRDGLNGTRVVIAAGGTAIAQDEASSVVWGMPGAIARAGLCHAILPLSAIAPCLIELLREPCA